MSFIPSSYYYISLHIYFWHTSLFHFFNKFFFDYWTFSLLPISTHIIPFFSIFLYISLCFSIFLYKDGWTALLWAKEKGHDEVAKLLILRGANVIERVNPKNNLIQFITYIKIVLFIFTISLLINRLHHLIFLFSPFIFSFYFLLLISPFISSF